MKVLLISTYDINGGAARSAYRLHEGLRNIHVNSHMLVQEKFSQDNSIIAPKLKLSQGIARAKYTFEALPLKFYSKLDKSSFSIQWLPDKVISQVTKIQPNIINLHWIFGSFLQIETISKLRYPLVWTLHDMCAFTGGCHYSCECQGYIKSCGTCPILGSSKNLDLSRWIWKRKAKAWENLNLTIVSPSSWLAKCASSSSLFKNLRIEKIPYGINTNKFKKINSNIARDILHLPQDKKLILFGSLKATSDKRKGFHLLQSAFQELSKTGLNYNCELVIFGSSESENSPKFGFKTHYLGSFNDDLSLALVYSAADVFVLPSLEDNLPNTVLEAIASGIPCVAFNIGGMPDMIEHQKNGYLAQPYEIEDLATGIAWVLESKERHQKLSYNAREKAEHEFALEIQAQRYISLYDEVITTWNHRKNIT